MNRIDLMNAALAKYPNTFIGYGNPNSNILIIGKECALESDTPDELEKARIVITYNNNGASWAKYCKKPYESNLITDWKTVPPFPEDWAKEFCPRFAFRGELYTTKEIIGKTSTTWYMYQKLLDLLRGYIRGGNDLLDFQEYCFITELSSIPMKKSRTSKKVKESIMTRVDGLLTEPFYNSFPIIIAACKGYVNKYHINLKDLFPQSRIIVSNQLSIMPRKGYLEEIAKKVNSNEAYCVI